MPTPIEEAETFLTFLDPTAFQPKIKSNDPQEEAKMMSLEDQWQAIGWTRTDRIGCPTSWCHSILFRQGSIRRRWCQVPQNVFLNIVARTKERGPIKRRR